MPDHQLHPYFRFLVDHPEYLHSAVDANLQDENIENNGNKRSDSVGGALSLLGSAYDSGEDEDATEAEQDSNRTLNGLGVISVGSVASQAVDKSKLSPGALENREASTKHSLAFQKGKPPLIKKNPSVNTFRAESSTSVKNFDRSSSCPPVTEKFSNYSIGSISRTESLIVEPPSDMKKTVDKIVDFIVKNGKQFETTLIEQDRKHGRFPFLLQSNLYHPYYSSVVQKVQESKQSGKSSICGKDESVVAHERKASPSMPNDSASITSGASDIPFESDNKEKFKMVIGKLKKDGQDPSPKASSQEVGVCVDAEAAAAILQAAARGIKNPEIGMVSSTTLNRKPIDPSSEGHNSIYGNSNLSKSKTSIQKSDQNGRSSSIPTTERRSAEATRNSDFSGGQLTKEEELRAARRRRAKMFVSMLKGGASSTAVPVRGSSVEPQASPVLGTGTEDHLPSKEREGNSTGVFEENKVLDKKVFNDEHDERRSKRKYRSRSERYDEEDYDEDAVINHHLSVEDEAFSDRDERGHKPSKRRKHRSHLSARSQKDYESDEEGRSHKHSKRKHRDHHSSEEDHDGNGDDSDRRHKSSRRKHSSHRSSHEIEEASSDKERERRRKKRHSSRHSRHERSHTKRHSTRDKESSPEHKHDSLSENEPLGKIVRETNSTDLEEGEIASKLSDQSRETGGEGRASREASLGVSSSHHTAPPPPSNPPDVSDELRAKIRAMLMATR
ncbi:hypothetical protein Leryth_005728 [Lithospermum erythrorhizon]|nr:hypothetical protein Leryth_005728 [Lithospermum erythrorhizon]